MISSVPPPVIVLFTRDLRIHDNPALYFAARRGPVLPVFVLDPAAGLSRSANRRAFLFESLRDLRDSLRALGAELFIRRGDTASELALIVRETGATSVHLAEDVSLAARRRLRHLHQRLAPYGVQVKTFDSHTVVAPGRLRPVGADHYRVFTPYWRRWSNTEWRDELPPPEHVEMPSRAPADAGAIPELVSAAGESPAGRPNRSGSDVSPDLELRGGESEGRRRVTHALAAGDPGQLEGTRLGAWLRFGCVSSLEVARRAAALGSEWGEELLRRLCWRDFFHQVTAAFPAIVDRPYRPGRERRWRRDPEAAFAWMRGDTGVEIVDAAMRQLAWTGWMPNRMRMVTASYLCKTLGVDWRVGASHFHRLLVDGDVPNNYGNWQWVAGCGNDTRPNRTFNPDRQARVHDPDGSYRERWLSVPVPEWVSEAETSDAT
ncbi:MAG: deoxyribodipyrimidine photo-lyase [Acidimicrobiales bacterium]|nr:MAG: deoxyribodipyrimidine photo-lyase [Acidimicrobiales bacterium]